MQDRLSSLSQVPMYRLDSLSYRRKSGSLHTERAGMSCDIPALKVKRYAGINRRPEEAESHRT